MLTQKNKKGPKVDPQHIEIMDNYAKIHLPNYLFCLIDIEDVEKCKPYRWYSRKSGKCSYYIGTPTWDKGKKDHLYLHRFILQAPHGLTVDHINHDTFDNRKSNLRLATKGENSFNRKKIKKSSSKYKGVSFDKSHKKWAASIKQKGKRYFLGYFDNEEEAAKAYNTAAIKYHGVFACLNKIP